MAAESPRALVAKPGGAVGEVAIQIVARLEFVLNGKGGLGVIDSHKAASQGARPNDVTDVFVENPRDPRVGDIRVDDFGGDFVEDSSQCSGVFCLSVVSRTVPYRPAIGVTKWLFSPKMFRRRTTPRGVVK